MQVAKWGNSLAVRIPADVARDLGLKEGDDIELRALSRKEVAVIAERQRREVALERLARFAWKLPDDYQFDRDEANER